ncbi:hypothetical protein [uncultured Roseobacter sp.]|uniref:hypothetical protein n=1 Tax=uncultured Roseobacter sp. TaxID=114847 RepID=UPI00260BC341|nr:hypothetical protein [uncultured Roseobacter sp.]
MVSTGLPILSSRCGTDAWHHGWRRFTWQFEPLEIADTSDITTVGGVVIHA